MLALVSGPVGDGGAFGLGVGGGGAYGLDIPVGTGDQPLTGKLYV